MLPIGIPMSLLVKSIIIMALHQIGLDSNILNEENVKESLQYLCPGVDICNRNELDPRVYPKEVDEKGYTSCCHGCSCDEDCHISGNCCFPGDREATPNSNESFVNMNGSIEHGNSSSMSDQNRILRNEHNASIDTNVKTPATTIGTMGIMRGMKGANQENLTVDKSNVSIDKDLAIKRCMYIQTGTADEFWVGRVPAVRMVTSPPPGGCQTNTTCPTLTQQSNQATCNSEDIFPWGDLFPVYSADYKLIFKNELCACCYGVFDYTHWLPVLVCDKTNNNQYSPISEHLSFMKQPNKLSSHCVITFQGVNTPLLENQCFMDRIGTCPETENVFHRVPDGVNLTRSEIVKACTNGPEAPIKMLQGVYKNVFCAMCNIIVRVEYLQCTADDDFVGSKSSSGKKFSFLLDTTSIQKLTKVGKKDTVFLDPIACLKNQSEWIEESCRTISCPSGQTRMDGVCTFPSIRWMFRGGKEVAINLKYKTKHTSVLRMLQTGGGVADEVVTAFSKTSPWPTDWIITKILHTSENNNFSPQLAVYLNTEISKPQKLTNHIKASLKRQWNIVLNGMNITFEQSFLKSELTGVFRYNPSWLVYEHEFESYINGPVNESTSFERIFSNSITTSIPFPLNKLVICEQISLRTNEYTILARGLILLNKLSNEIMFNFEFERVEEVNGEIVPFICLTDTPLVMRRENSGAAAVLVFKINLVLTMYIVDWIVGLHCAPIG